MLMGLWSTLRERLRANFNWRTQMVRRDNAVTELGRLAGNRSVTDQLVSDVRGAAAENTGGFAPRQVAELRPASLAYEKPTPPVEFDRPERREEARRQGLLEKLDSNLDDAALALHVLTFEQMNEIATSIARGFRDGKTDKCDPYHVAMAIVKWKNSRLQKSEPDDDEEPSEAVAATA